jgi:hypothetical protein
MKLIDKLRVILFGILVFSCNPMEDVYKELDANDEGLVKDFTYTMEDTDYAIFSDENNADSMVAENNMFADFDQAKRLVPRVLNDKFSYFGAGSSVNAFFEVDGGLEELSAFINSPILYVGSEELAAVNEAAEAAGFLSPSFDVEESLIKVLDNEIQDPLEGDIVTLQYGYADADPIIDFDAAGPTIAHEEYFTNDIEAYSTFSLVGDEVWEYNQFFNGNAAMGAFNGADAENNDWLVSPSIDLTDLTESELRFHQVINYLDVAPAEILKVKVSSNFTGDVTTATWTELTVDQWPAGNSWSEEVWSTMDISAFDGSIINVAFQLDNTNLLDGPTWEIGEVIVEAVADVSVEVVAEPVNQRMLFSYVGGSWEVVDGIDYLSAPDYDAMGEQSGQPGRYNNFSNDTNPDDYLPTYLNLKYPYAHEEDQLTVMYMFYNGKTVVRGDIYTFTQGAWVVTEVSLNFGYDGSNWVPDNTIKYTLAFDDYTTIGNEFENSNPGGSASALQYRNFDLSLWSSSQIFDAVVIVLENVFPNTESGQKYLVTYDTWEPGNGTGELYLIYENDQYVVFE